MSSNWIKQDGVFYPVGDFKTYKTPGPGIFTIFYNEHTFQLGLRKFSDKFEFPFKIYDLGLDSFNGMVKTVWESEYYVKKNQNLGIIFNGLKGAGKTIGAKLLCNNLDLPVILISDYIPGTLEFIGRLEFECVVLIDEAEKTFDGQKKESSHTLLKMIDGVMNKSRKLYILTTNSLDINENLLGRPGRIRYIKEVGGITNEAVVEYLKDNLAYEDMLIDIMKVVKSLKTNTIDTLKCIVDEVNMTHSLGSLEYLNLELMRKNYYLLTFQPTKEHSIKDLEKGMDYLRDLGLSDKDLINRIEEKFEINLSNLEEKSPSFHEYLHNNFGINITIERCRMVEPKVGITLESGIEIIEETVDNWFICKYYDETIYVRFLEAINKEHRRRTRGLAKYAATLVCEDEMAGGVACS